MNSSKLIPRTKAMAIVCDMYIGQDWKSEFRIPHDLQGNLHPQILAILRNREDECDWLAEVLYTKGLTQEYGGYIFTQIYDHHYSKYSISKMVKSIRAQVKRIAGAQHGQPLQVMSLNCIQIKIHRKHSVSKGVSYTALAVTEEKTI